MPRLSFRFLSLSACLALALVPQARADVKMPSVFGSHMVLQRDQPDKVYGTADPGEEVSVSIAGQSKTTKANDQGRWSVTLDPLKTSTEPLSMTVKGKNTLTFDDILVGEVWLCSGQSNMGFNLGSAYDADLEALTAKFPNMRLISVPQVGTQEPQDDFNGHWEPCTPESARSFSAVGFFFGRQLYQTLDNVPVGLIDDAWGGSAAEAWVRRDILAKDPKYADLLASWEEREAQYREGEGRQGRGEGQAA